MLRSYWTILAVLLLYCNLIYCKKPSEDTSDFLSYANSDLLLEHAFGAEDKFSPRGSITFKTAKSTTASIINDVELGSGDLQKLQELVNEDGLYFIRTPIKIGGTFTQDSSNETDYVLTFVKACYLYGSDLQETITVAIDHSGNVIGLSIVSPRSSCKTTVMNSKNVFNSTVHVQHQVAGAIPDTQTFVRKIEQEKSDQAAGKGADNRSFLAKYWMYIIPVFLILMLSSQAEPPAEGGGGSE